MNLEIKHLAPYLPYGLKLISPELVRNKIYTLVSSNPYTSYDSGLTISDVFTLRAKPVLHPMENSQFIMEKIKNRYNKEFENKVLNVGFSNTGEFILFGEMIGLEIPMPLWAYEMMFENHFDVYGLIPEELAVSYSINLKKEPSHYY